MQWPGGRWLRESVAAWPSGEVGLGARVLEREKDVAAVRGVPGAMDDSVHGR
jgi:hypothetical protein